MNVDPLENRHQPLLTYNMEIAVDELIERINGDYEEIRLSPTDKLSISYGLQFLRLELIRNTLVSPE
jgi:hypothetical protein